MAGRKPGFRHNQETVAKFYVYRIFNGETTVYIGKGCGYRLAAQIKRFGLPGEKIEQGLTEERAFEREVHWIAELMPTDNKNPGGRGGKSGKRTAYMDKDMLQIQVVGSRRYAARLLLRKLSHSNCISYGLSKLDLYRIAEVASGPRG